LFGSVGKIYRPKNNLHNCEGFDTCELGGSIFYDPQRWFCTSLKALFHRPFFIPL